MQIDGKKDYAAAPKVCKNWCVNKLNGKKKMRANYKCCGNS